VRVKGHNGAGKTTLLRIASGLIRPDGGTVTRRGLDPERDRRAYLAGLGYLSTGDRGLYARLSPRQHLELCADLALTTPDLRGGIVDRAIERFGLAAFVDRRVERSSTGQRQRVRLALAFLHEPVVVLLDEPANSLDDGGLVILSDALERLKRRGGGALWCAPSATDPPIPFDERHILEGAVLAPE
jgi:ABC-type multidrug transport system ATPase subunit